MLVTRSGALATVPLDDALLLPGAGSDAAEVTEAVFVIVPVAVGFTLIVMVNAALAPDASDARLQLTVPVPPTTGVVQLNAGPLVCIADTNVVPAGTGSLRDTVAAASGPLFVTMTV